MIHDKLFDGVRREGAVAVSPQILGLTLSEPAADAWMYLGALFTFGDVENHGQVAATRELLEYCAGEAAAVAYDQVRSDAAPDDRELLMSAAEMWIGQARPSRLFDVLSATNDAVQALSELRGRLFFHFAQEQAHRERMVSQYANSPIEEALGLELVRRGCAVLPPVNVGYVHGYMADTTIPAVLYMQHDFGRYRADFFVTVPRVGGVVVVECDGHDFHEKTKQQAARDKQRDRWFLSKGWPTMRFTGSEIHYQVERCADEVMTLLSQTSEQTHARASTMRATDVDTTS
ncbi:MAG: DUF559 domain-containing protein [Pseudomonadota bacterium]